MTVGVDTHRILQLGVQWLFESKCAIGEWNFDPSLVQSRLDAGHDFIARSAYFFGGSGGPDYSQQFVSFSLKREDRGARERTAFAVLG